MAKTIDLPDINLTIYDELGSTNSYLIQAAEQDANLPSGTAVQALKQTSGRGRYDRHWLSQQGNLALSIFLKPMLPIDQQSQLAFVTGLAAAETFADSGVDPKKINLKWPNDVLVDKQKICGILIERAAEGLVLGFGANLVFAPEERTSLHMHSDMAISLDDFRELFIKHLIHYYEQWQSNGFPAIHKEWMGYAWHLGEEITIKLRHEHFNAIFKDLDKDGALVVEECSSGQLRKITSGDIFA
ncbi:MAG: biotin--[acetyl-CoA-carboxylase] ligase [Micavibrio sp.]|nr:biotin--[acetyl-CoA-carboxylase] ligase [Micavibrio sp.]|tara:strand:+ start:776 stop:1504 length:729 start_codon:yes stop_codon:yes gene_type:complete